MTNGKDYGYKSFTSAWVDIQDKIDEYVGKQYTIMGEVYVLKVEKIKNEGQSAIIRHWLEKKI